MLLIHLLRVEIEQITPLNFVPHILLHSNDDDAICIRRLGFSTRKLLFFHSPKIACYSKRAAVVYVRKSLYLLSIIKSLILSFISTWDEKTLVDSRGSFLIVVMLRVSCRVVTLWRNTNFHSNKNIIIDDGWTPKTWNSTRVSVMINKYSNTFGARCMTNQIFPSLEGFWRIHVYDKISRRFSIETKASLFSFSRVRNMRKFADDGVAATKIFGVCLFFSKQKHSHNAWRY